MRKRLLTAILLLNLLCGCRAPETAAQKHSPLPGGTLSTAEIAALAPAQQQRWKEWRFRHLVAAFDLPLLEQIAGTPAEHAFLTALRAFHHSNRAGGIRLLQKLPPDTPEQLRQIARWIIEQEEKRVIRPRMEFPDRQLAMFADSMLTVTGRVDGKPIKFVLDTGAPFSLIRPQDGGELPASDDGKMWKADELKLCGIRFAAPALLRMESPVNLIGWDILRHLHVKIYRDPQKCSGYLIELAPPQEKPADAFPLLDFCDRALLELTFPAEPPCYFMLDTGGPTKLSYHYLRRSGRLQQRLEVQYEFHQTIYHPEGKKRIAPILPEWRFRLAGTDFTCYGVSCDEPADSGCFTYYGILGRQLWNHSGIQGFELDGPNGWFRLSGGKGQMEIREPQLPWWNSPNPFVRHTARTGGTITAFATLPFSGPAAVWFDHDGVLPFYLPGAVIAAVPAWLLTNWFHDTKAGTILGPFREFDREILRQLVEKTEKE